MFTHLADSNPPAPGEDGAAAMITEGRRRRRHRHRLAGAGAAVILAVATTAGVTLAGDGDDPRDQLLAGEPDSPTADGMTNSDPIPASEEDLLGTWTPDDASYQVDATSRLTFLDGEFDAYDGCNTMSGGAWRIQDGVLRIGREVVTTVMLCGYGDGDDLFRVVSSRPSVALLGGPDRLELRAGEEFIVFTRLGGPPVDEAAELEPPGFEVLANAGGGTHGSGRPHAATNDDEYDELWAAVARPGAEQPEVDFAEHVVVSLSWVEGGCGIVLDGFFWDGQVLAPTFVTDNPETPNGFEGSTCTMQAIPRGLVVALDRAPLTPGFTLHLTRGIFGEEHNLTVDLTSDATTG